MNGAGNDFIIINNFKEHIAHERFPQIARRLCERHLSIGADGLMVVDEARDGGDFRLLFFNSDGSLGEMCGNGSRCICRYGYDNGLAGEVQHVETTAGTITGTRVDERRYRVRLNDPGIINLDITADAAGKPVNCSYIELGNPGLPHAVTPMRGLTGQTDDQLRTLGRTLRYSVDFPKGANVNFYEMLGGNHVYIKTFERGVEDFTYACGTGTASTAVVLMLKGIADRTKPLTADMRGGRLVIDAEFDGDTVKNIYLTGDTTYVASGTVTDEELKF